MEENKNTSETKKQAEVNIQGEIILYQPDDTIRLDVLMEGDTVWLKRQQLSKLFGHDVKTISKHINNALREELKNVTVVANFATTATDGKTYMVEKECRYVHDPFFDNRQKSLSVWSQHQGCRKNFLLILG